MNKWINQRCCTFRVSHVTDRKGIPTSQGYEDYKMKHAKHIRQRNSQWWLLLVFRTDITLKAEFSEQDFTNHLYCSPLRANCCLGFLDALMLHLVSYNNGWYRVSKKSWANAKKRKAITPEIHTENPSYTHFTYINLAFKVKSLFVHNTP